MHALFLAAATMFFANGLFMRRLTLDFFRWPSGTTDRDETSFHTQLRHGCHYKHCCRCRFGSRSEQHGVIRKIQGGGIAENDDSIYFGVTARDFDVTIGPAGNGFSVEWTSVIRGGDDPKQNRTLDLRQPNARSSPQPNRASGRQLDPKIPSPTVNCVGRA